jgi:3-deoxy-D-manno-octulosonate 8-phosphate phosphatase (KDO 8-P phosphatase)
MDMTQIPAAVVAKAAAIKLMVFDVDGVLTDGSLYYGHDGREYKVFHSRDGHGMKMLQRSGVEIAIITARSSQAVAHRMANLGITHVYQGALEKLPAFMQLVEKLGVASDAVAYVGDDVVDLPVMTRVGLAIAVADAHEDVSKRAHWCTRHPGGRGAARDACELVMRAQGTYEKLLAGYLADKA